MAGIGSKMTEKDRRKYHQKRKEHHVFGQAALGTMEVLVSVICAFPTLIDVI